MEVWGGRDGGDGSIAELPCFGQLEFLSLVDTSDRLSLSYARVVIFSE